jgi:hypothetical protein
MKVTLMAEQLLIYQKIYDLVLWLYPAINRIPKSHRLVLGRYLEEVSIQILVLVIKANKKRDKERVSLREKISEMLDILRILIRLTKDRKFMSIKQYVFAVEKINEIGRMLNAWMKSSNVSPLENKTAVLWSSK